jgi:subfamily B ATP-binding cassette protein MsbA
VAFRYLRPIFRKRNKIRSEVSGRLGETLSGIQIVKAYRMETKEHDAFRDGVERIYEMIVKTVTGISVVSAFGTITIGAIGTVILVVGGKAIQAGAMTIGDFVMFVFLAGLLSAPIIQMANVGTQISEALAGLDRVRDLLNRKTEDIADEERESLGEIHGAIAFENVYFRYERDEDVLVDVSFNAPAGSTTALVGSSGAGKSTIASLVMAFHRPRTGRVLVDGRDLDTIRVSEYRNILGVVLQENFLFDGTIAENIRFARPDATMAHVEEAGRIANCEEFVSSFPDRYDTVIGERGIKLSGGQRQRVAIARALVANPRILILDEATSSLDTKSERLIQAGIERLRTGRTTFVIAHRLSTIRSADQILVIEDGRVVESGTHAELLAGGGRYRELHDEQHRWEEDLFVNPGEENYDRQIRL